MKIPSWSLWVLAALLTVASAAYQKLSGPTHAITSKMVVGKAEIAFRLPRSHGGPGDARIHLSAPDRAIGGTMEFRRFRSNDEWSSQPLQRQGDVLIARIPHQPPAGKVMYRVWVGQEGAEPVALTPEPLIIRFRGGVPPLILLLHILLMFAAMLFSTRTGLEALFKRPRVYGLTLWTIVLLFLGGMIGGPVVQKYAFGAFWTGWPFGHDLTDNKTAVALCLWLVALWRIRKKSASRGWVLAASFVLLTIYAIPHSVLGSELDYTQLPQTPAP
jgi:hypothetical protein